MLSRWIGASRVSSRPNTLGVQARGGLVYFVTVTKCCRATPYQGSRNHNGAIMFGWIAQGAVADRCIRSQRSVDQRLVAMPRAEFVRQAWT
jgi:hypothetical protein